MDENPHRIQPQSSMGSDTISEQSESIESQNATRTICLVASAADNPDTFTAAKSFTNTTIVTSETGAEHSTDTIFVLPSFDGEIFDALYKSRRILLGPPALQQLAQRRQPLPINTRPLYALAMGGCVVCVTGFRDKETLGELVTIVHQLGGSIRKDLSQKVTHLIANYTGGAKYEYADTFRLPVMRRSWVCEAWTRRDEIGFEATEATFLAEHKLKPFYGARVCFLGFAEDEEKDMINVLQENGGVITNLEDATCTHVVMDPDCDIAPSNAPTSDPPTLHITPSTPSPTTNTPLATVAEQPFAHTPSPVDRGRKRKFLTPKQSTFDTKRNCHAAHSESRVTRRMSRMFLTPRDYFATRRRTIDAQLNDSRFDASVSSTATLSDVSGVTCRPPRVNLFTRSANKLRNRTRKQSIGDMSRVSVADVSVYSGAICPPIRIPRIILSPANPPSDLYTIAPNEGGATTPAPNTDQQRTDAVVDDCGGATIASSLTDRTDSILRAHLVKPEWFWTSVQKETCLPEKNYLFDGHTDGIMAPSPTLLHPSTPSASTHTSTTTTPSSASRRKRKRLHETLSSLAQVTKPAAVSPCVVVGDRRGAIGAASGGGEASTTSKQRRSSVGVDAASAASLLSMTGGSFILDCTVSPGDVGAVQTPGVEGKGGECSKRQQVFVELVHTETNYVNILHTIVTTFKKHLEDMPSADQLLNPTELKIIFGRVPQIYRTHVHMLNALRNALASYTDGATSIGDIILRSSTDLLHAYPPFINAYEDMKETLTQCDRCKPRFHAFLKACQTRPECGRQGLAELMIRPVQRLGSVSLLLNDVLKHTAKTHPDHALLVQALASIKEVLAHINEDKRKAEGQRVMFDIFNEIDNCPPDVVSSHRSFVARCNILQLSASDSTITTSKGAQLSLFLFSDQLGICKRRHNHRSNSNPFPPATHHHAQQPPTLKSPNSGDNVYPVSTERVLNGTIGGGHLKVGGVCAVNGAGGGVGVGGPKAYKHVKLMSLSAIRRVIDIRDTEDCQRVCSLIYMNNGELKEKLFSFAITDEEVDKTTFLKTLCHQMATNACTADADKFMAYCDAQQLDIDTSYLHGTLSKAVKFAHRTRLKVGRAFSFNKTPAKLKRAVSSMMSPFGSSNNLTPASQLAQMRLASYSNINELGHGAIAEGAPMAPLSVQPTRKMKPSALGVSVLKRL